VAFPLYIIKDCVLAGWASKFRMDGVGPDWHAILDHAEGIWITKGTKSHEKHENGRHFYAS